MGDFITDISNGEKPIIKIVLYYRLNLKISERFLVNVGTWRQMEKISLTESINLLV